MNAEILGRGTLAAHLRGAVSSDIPSVVIVVDIDGATVVPSMSLLTDELIDELFEQPMQLVITSLQEAYNKGCLRIVLVVPTTGMSGGACYAAQAALAESARILVKSAARQWGAAGITVNAVAVDPVWFDIDPIIAGPISLAPRALADGVDPIAVLCWLCSSAAGDITGQTIVCDGGLWM